MRQRRAWWIVIAVLAGCGEPHRPPERPPADGKWVRQEIIATPGLNESPQFSPDTTRIAFQSTRSGSFEIWISSRDGVRQPWRFEGPLVGSPRWSPDGERLAFDCRYDSPHGQVYVGSSDGDVSESRGGWWTRRTFAPADDDALPSWSHDGKWIYFGSTRGGHGWQVWKVSADAGTPVQVTKGGGQEAFANAKFVYYAKFSQRGLWKIPVGGGAETEVVTEGGYGRWSLTDHAIYYLRDDLVMWVSDTGGGKLLRVQEPAASIRGMTASRDGNYILIVHGDDKHSSIVLYSRGS